MHAANTYSIDNEPDLYSLDNVPDFLLAFVQLHATTGLFQFHTAAGWVDAGVGEMIFYADLLAVGLVDPALADVKCLYIAAEGETARPTVTLTTP